MVQRRAKVYRYDLAPTSREVLFRFDAGKYRNALRVCSSFSDGCKHGSIRHIVQSRKDALAPRKFERIRRARWSRGHSRRDGVPRQAIGLVLPGREASRPTRRMV